MGAFSEAVRDPILATGRNLLISIHGFDNDFIAAITRAAYVREWFATTGEAAADTTIVAFTWPSLGSLLEYHTNQEHAGVSGLHIGFFLHFVAGLIERHRQAGRRDPAMALSWSVNHNIRLGYDGPTHKHDHRDIRF